MPCPRWQLLLTAPLEVPAAPLGIVLYLYLLAPYVLLDYLSVFYNVLADAHLFLEDRALVHNDLFLGYRHHDLVVCDLGLRRGLTLYGHALNAYLLVAGGHLYALAVCSHPLTDPYCAGLALADACDELFFGSLHPHLVLVLKVVASTLVYAFIMGGVLAKIAGFGVSHGHARAHGASVGALI